MIRASNLLVEGSGFVPSFNFVIVERFRILMNGRDKRVVSG